MSDISARPPAMDVAKGSLVLLIERYLGGSADPFVRLPVVHESTYFTQEAGEPLRLNYAKV